MDSKSKNTNSKFLNSFKRSKLSLTSKRIHENTMNKYDKLKESSKTKQNSTISDSDILERNNSFAQNSFTFSNFEKKNKNRPKTSRIYKANNQRLSCDMNINNKRINRMLETKLKRRVLYIKSQDKEITKMKSEIKINSIINSAMRPDFNRIQR